MNHPELGCRSSVSVKLPNTTQDPKGSIMSISDCRCRLPSHRYNLCFYFPYQTPNLRHSDFLGNLLYKYDEIFFFESHDIPIFHLFNIKTHLHKVVPPSSKLAFKPL